MKKLKKGVLAAVAITLIGLVSSVGAMNLKTDGLGDALLFPAFDGNVDNYFTVTNNHNEWIQAHVRFRGALWSAELLDFDIILSPGDVFVFRLADLDGDGQWELDQAIDQDNWRYTDMLETSNMVDASNLLEPRAGVVSDAELAHQRRAGYVEVIGECILYGLTKTRALQGVNAWVWSDAANNFANPLGSLLDVPNVLSGTAFISDPSESNMQLAYNAVAIQDFRTNGAAHRIDTYNLAPLAAPAGDLPLGDPRIGVAQTGVILHIDDSNATDGAYVYRWRDSDPFEERISFNNTWGPTLADGDDADGLINDFWDLRVGGFTTNSISEIETAVAAAGQVFNAYYFDTDDMTSWYFVHFPTKFYYGESSTLYTASVLKGREGVAEIAYIDEAVRTLMNLGVNLNVQVWDIFEHVGGIPTTSGNTSPALPVLPEVLTLGHELNLFSIDGFVKPVFSSAEVDGYELGRVVYDITGAQFPGLAYTFEAGTHGLSNFRAMQR